MKYIVSIVVFSSMLCVSCVKKKAVHLPLSDNASPFSLDIPDTTVDIIELTFDRKTSFWSHNGKPYSGYAIRFYDGGTHLKEKTGILKGKKQNQDSIWYENGNLKQIANYHLGKLHGQKKYWLSDSGHTLISLLNYQLGKPNGEQKTWYPSGELHKKLNLKQGKEVGLQQAYRRNGELYANYEAKNGRVFGLKKASLCFGLENENIEL